MNHHNIKNAKGFTLIEIVATLILVGILTSVGGLGIVEMTKGYLFTRDAVSMGYKSQVAMDRIQKSLLNMTVIKSGSDSDTINLKSSLLGEDRDETINLSGSSLTLTSDLTGSSAHTLVDSVKSFVVSYWEEGASSGASSPPSAASSLAKIQVDLELETDSGQTLSYSTAVTPRNTYVPSDLEISTGGSGGETGQATAVGCFIATAAYDSYDAWPVLMLREFRDKILLKTDAGTSFVNWYYHHGPGWAKIIEKHHSLKWTVKTALAPVAGFVFMILFFPQGLFILLILSIIFGRLMVYFLSRKREKRLFAGAGGSIMFSVIIIILVMSVFSVSMMQMFSSSQMSKVPTLFSEKAYYLAFSGLQVAVKEFNGDEDQFIDDMTENQGTKTYTMGDDCIDIQFQGYWYKPFYNGDGDVANWYLDAAGMLPGTIEITDDVTALFMVEKDGETTEIAYEDKRITPILNNTRVSFLGESSPTLRTVLGNSIDGDICVYPMAKADDEQDFTTYSYAETNSEELILTGWSSAAHAAMFLPPRNGLISLTATKDGETDSEALIIMYDHLDTSDSTIKLVGLYAPDNISGVAEPGNYTVADDTAVTFGKYSIIRARGRMGSGANEVCQTLRFYKPLESAELFLSSGGMIKFDDGDGNKMKSIMGGYSVQDGALKVTDTDQNISYTSADVDDADGVEVSLQESMTAVSFSEYDSQDPNFLEDMWQSSTRKMSYQVQTKVKFTETEDDVRTCATPVNLPAHYMPGISFRVKQPLSPANDAANNGLTTYYGLSIMRGLYGTTQYGTDVSETEGACGSTDIITYLLESEDDDIPDTFMKDHGSTSDAQSVTSYCDGTSGDSMGSGTWNDDPMYDDIPYLVLWQKNQSTDENGDPLIASDSCGSSGDGTIEPWKYLSYMPLVEYKPVSVYYYAALKSDYYLKSQEVCDKVCKDTEWPYTDSRIITRNGEEVCQIKYLSWFTWKWKDWYFSYENCHDELAEEDKISNPNLEAGWYEGTIAGDPRNNSIIFISDPDNGESKRSGPYPAWKLRDPRGLFQTVTVENVSVLGTPNDSYIIRAPSTVGSGDAGSPVNYFESGTTEAVGYLYSLTDQSENIIAVKSLFDYRLYPKPWVTLGLTIYEMQGNFDCNDATPDPVNGTDFMGVDGSGNYETGEERVNYISAFIGGPENFTSPTDSSMNRAGLSRWGSSTIYSEIDWPQSLLDSQVYFWSGVFREGPTSSKTYHNGTDNGYEGYTSEVVDSGGACGTGDYKLVERGEDDDGRYTGLYSLAYNTAQYFGDSDGFTYPEFGLHTLGINASGDYADGTSAGFSETCYFDDLAWRFFKNVSISGFPGIVGQ